MLCSSPVPICSFWRVWGNAENTESCIKTIVTGVLCVACLHICVKMTHLLLQEDFCHSFLRESGGESCPHWFFFLLENGLEWWKKLQKPLRCLNSKSQNSIQNTCFEVMRHHLGAQGTHEFFKEYDILWRGRKYRAVCLWFQDVE